MLDTTRRVATPEGIELTLRLAGPVPRALAWSVDFLLRAAVVLVVMMIASRFGRAGMGVVLIAAFFVEWLLPAWFEAMWSGQTPGKRLFRLAVLNDDGTPVRWPGALTRNLLRAADFLPFLYGVGLITMLMNRDFKRLGDLAAGTVVVYQAEKVAAARAIPQAPPQPPPLSLSPEEQRAVLDLAERSATFTRERFEELAEIPTPLVGRAVRDAAATRMLGIANYLAGQMKQAPFEASACRGMGRVREISRQTTTSSIRPGGDAHALPPRVPEPRARRRAALQRRPRRPAEPAGAARPPRAVRQPAARVAADPRLHARRLSAPGARRVAPGARGERCSSSGRCSP